MTTKQWLEQSKGIIDEIKILENEKNIAALQSARITHDITDKIAKIPRSRNDTALVKYADSEYIARIDKRLADLRNMLGEIEHAIYSVDDSVQRLLLINRYVLFKKWKDIAIEMSYSPKNIFKIHNKALNNVKMDTK